MKRIVKGSAVVLVSAFAVAGSAFWVSQSEAAQPDVNVQPAGINFGLHPSQDTEFCLENIPSGTNASPASIQECASRDSQHWVFAKTPSGGPGIIDGSGTCLQFGGSVKQSIQLVPCTLKPSQHFKYSLTGQITTSGGAFCLQYAQAATSAFVTMPKCVAGLATQKWILSH
jgi:hypothetical protein